MLTQGESTGGTEGSVVNHVAFRVQSFAAVEAAGLKVARLANFPGVGSTFTPEGERIELFENAATQPDVHAGRRLSGRGGGPTQPSASDSDRLPSHPSVPACRQSGRGEGVVREDVRRCAGQALELRRRRSAWRELQLQRSAEANRAVERAHAVAHRAGGRESRGVLPEARIARRNL